MKTLLATILITASCALVRAQDTITYQPYPEHYGSWLFENMSFSTEPQYHYSRTVWSGDTLINSVTYTRIFQSGASFPSDPTPAMQYKGGIRQDIPNRKLYFIDLNETEHDISIDQFLEVGDTIENTPYLFMAIDFQEYDLSAEDVSKFLVASVDSVPVGNSYRSSYNLSMIDYNNELMNENLHIEYLSGIGGSLYLFERYSKLECHSEGDSLVYGSTLNPHSVSCTLGLSEADFAAHVTVYPNPASTSVTLSSAVSISNTALEIIDLSGKTVFRNAAYTFDESIPVADLEAGSYLIRISNGEQRAVLPLQLVK